MSDIPMAYTYMGRDIRELSREELVEVVVELFKESQRDNERHHTQAAALCRELQATARAQKSRPLLYWELIA